MRLEKPNSRVERKETCFGSFKWLSRVHMIQVKSRRQPEWEASEGAKIRWNKSLTFAQAWQDSDSCNRRLAKWVSLILYHSLALSQLELCETRIHLGATRTIDLDASRPTIRGLTLGEAKRSEEISKLSGCEIDRPARSNWLSLEFPRKASKGNQVENSKCRLRWNWRTQRPRGWGSKGKRNETACFRLNKPWEAKLRDFGRANSDCQFDWKFVFAWPDIEESRTYLGFALSAWTFRFGSFEILFSSFRGSRRQSAMDKGREGSTYGGKGWGSFGRPRVSELMALRWWLQLSLSF